MDSEEESNKKQQETRSFDSNDEETHNKTDFDPPQSTSSVVIPSVTSKLQKKLVKIPVDDEEPLMRVKKNRKLFKRAKPSNDLIKKFGKILYDLPKCTPTEVAVIKDEIVQIINDKPKVRRTVKKEDGQEGKVVCAGIEILNAVKKSFTKPPSQIISEKM